MTVKAQNYFNYAANKPVKASTADNVAQRITDGTITSWSWRCNTVNKEQWIQIDLTADFDIYAAHIYFDDANTMPLDKFRLQYNKEGQWMDIPGATIENNFSIRLPILFNEPVGTSSIRLVAVNAMPFGVAEIALWGKDVPSMPYGVQTKAQEAFVADTHWVCVNQVAYNIDAPKRFTVPTAKSNLRFDLIDVQTQKVVFSGKLKNKSGDFSAFNPSDSEGKEYYIRVKGDKLKEGKSFPFEIGRHAIQRMSYKPAVWFMNDCRSVVGTHPSGYGGCAWRDGAYYTYEVPGMVMLYLSDPSYFNRMPVSLSWNKERDKVLSPNFKTTNERGDRDVLVTAQNYYNLLPQPKREDIPDIIQDIRFGVGWILLDPITIDASTGGDPVGERMHGQTIEQLAYFLYAYPAMKEYIEDEFYRMVLTNTFLWWERAGLFEVITDIGTGKGRNAPGHSILPNLMMYEVAKREKPEWAERFMQAAIAQTKWFIETLDWNNPAHSKGQRMSEPKTILGLVHFCLNYPEMAPAGLREKLHALAVNMVEKSDNMWDFRRFDMEDNWTIPGFNEAGNIAGFPACALGVAMTLDEKDKTLKNRMVQLAYAGFDNLYGRNPMNCHSANHPELGFEGVDKGWPYFYTRDVTARLELTRGSITSLPGTEMYPFNPKGLPRHPEGWTAYNAVWDMSLAFLNFFEGVGSARVLREVDRAFTESTENYSPNIQ